MLGRVYQKVMGLPFVYDKVRPFFMGGLELSPFYDEIQARSGDTILDIGCGTGNALDYLAEFESYVGFDVDAGAIEAAQEKAREMPHVSFNARHCEREDVKRIAPSQVVMCGVLHHLPDDAAIELMRASAASPRFRQMFTLDVAYYSGSAHWISNTLSFLDRGKHVRRPEAYAALVEKAGLRQKRTNLFWNDPHRRRAKYYVMVIERAT